MAKKLCVVAFSGGLDTSYCVVHLRQDLGYDVVTSYVDTGGGDSGEKEKVAARSKELGALEHIHLDATEEYYHKIVRHLLRGNVLRGNVYPLAVGAERAIQAMAICRLAKERKAHAICHGSTGAGNDQLRFDLAIAVLAPECEVLTPIRTANNGAGIKREEATAYLKKFGFDVPAKTTLYSINKGLWGTSIGGGDTKDSALPLPEDAYYESQSPLGGPAAPEEITIGFERGEAVRFQGESLHPVEVIRRVTAIGHKHGVGRGMHLGTTILGFKGRVAFEAPAPAILIPAHRELEKLVQTRLQGQTSQALAETYGNAIHEGKYFDPALRDIEAYLESSQAHVSGEVRVQLYRGQAFVLGVKSPFSLLGAGATYGEEAKGYTGFDSAGFCKIASLEAKAFAEVARRNGGSIGN